MTTATVRRPLIVPRSSADLFVEAVLVGEAEAVRSAVIPRTVARRYRADPAAFVVDVFDWRRDEGEGPAPYQLEILDALHRRHRAAARLPHGGGKTALDAWAVLHFALTRDADERRDWKVPTTAGSWRQLEHYLWPELRKWARRLRPEILGRAALIRGDELLTLRLRLSRGEAFAVASDEPYRIEGAHADSLLYVFDEAKSIPAPTFDAAEGAFASGDVYALATSTPGDPSGRFYEIHARADGYRDWWVRHVSLDECIRAGRIAPQWAADRKAQWGEDSPVYRTRCLAEFAQGATDGVVPLAWVEAAIERWRSLRAAGRLPKTVTAVGVDVGDGGDDPSVLALRAERCVVELRYSGGNTMETTGRVKGVVEAHPGCYAVIDVVGVGTGIRPRLAEQQIDARPFSAAEATSRKNSTGEFGFVNKRAAAWWGLRERLDPALPAEAALALPPDDRLVGDLTTPKWHITSAGKIAVESKDEIKRRLKRSTDAGDAVVMAFWQDTKVAFVPL